MVGGLLGAVAGGIAGTAIDQNSTRRGIEVTVQKDDGQQVTIAQHDDGDVQMGDRVVDRLRPQRRGQGRPRHRLPTRLISSLAIVGGVMARGC